MNPARGQNRSQPGATRNESLAAPFRKIERRQWWLWSVAVLVTLLLTLGIISFVFLLREDEFESIQAVISIRGLLGLVLLFDVYALYQQLQVSRMRKQLIEREELFRLISENAADMIAVVDGKGQRIYNSPAYEQILGYSPEELHGAAPLEHVHPDDRPLVQQAAEEAVRTGVGRRIEYRMRHKDGPWLLLESTASVVLDGAGQVDKLVVVNRDITGRRRLEEQFRQAQKMDAIGRLSGGVAHDFNNLLGVMIGYAEFLEERLPQTDPLRDSVEEILKAGKRAASLTRQLLAFSRQQVLDPSILDLNAVVSDMEKMLRRLIGEDIELTTSLDAGLGKVKADQGQLEQAIMNFAVNARDAMPQGGKLIIATANFEMDEAFVRQYPYPVQPGPYIRLTVTDTGSGMDAGTKARIFEPFFTTKEKGKGTGLGLSVVYGVVKQSDGYIDVASEPGAGTTFTIYLPRGEDAVTEQKPSEDVTARGGQETVLLAEDEASLRTLTSGVLQRWGYTVLEAKTGEQALALSQQYREPIDLLLTDVVMPGINGHVLAQELLAQRPKIKVVYMSGYTGQGVGSGVLPAGSLFLQKPFTKDALAAKIQEAMEGQQVPPVAANSSVREAAACQRS